MHALIPFAISLVFTPAQCVASFCLPAVFEIAESYPYWTAIAGVEFAVYLTLAIVQIFTGEGKDNINNIWLTFNNYSQIGLWLFYIFHLFMNLMLLFPSLSTVLGLSSSSSVDPILSYIDITFQTLFVPLYYWAKRGARKYIEYMNDGEEIFGVNEM